MTITIWIKILFLFFYCIVFASCVRKPFKITRHTVCAKSVGDEIHFYRLSPEQCAKKCFLRSACVGLTYKRHGRKCSFYLSDESLEKFKISEEHSLQSDYYLNQCILIIRNDISLTEVTTDIAECNQNEEFDAAKRQCVARECPVPSLYHGETKGNVLVIGSRMVFTCGLDARVKTRSLCLETGIWTPRPVCDTSCLQFLVPTIPDSSLTASSSYHFAHNAKRGRLDITVYTPTVVYNDAWSAGSKSDDPNPYIQAMFEDIMNINGVVTKGRILYDQFVKTYIVSYSQDCSEPYMNVNDNSGEAMLFVGNNDGDSEVFHYLPTTIRAKCVRIYPKEYHLHRSMRFDIIGCSDRCSTYLVSGPYGVPDSSLTASSFADVTRYTSIPERARLDTPDTTYLFGGYFIQESVADTNIHYIQVKFRTTRMVASIITQGVNTTLHAHINDSYVSSYTVAYSEDCVVYNNVTDSYNSNKVFKANSDWSSKVENILPKPIEALCVRIRPLTYNERNGLRFDLKGCIDHTCPESQTRVIRPKIYANFRLKITSGAYTHTYAIGSCLSQKGTLADLSKPEIHQYLTTILNSCSVYPVNSYYWIDRPTHVGVQECAGIEANTGSLEVRKNLSCGQTNGYICQWT